MNLVESILNQVSGDALGKLSALVNSDGNTTRSAISAAVPTVLASLAGLSSSKDGANKLASTLEGLDTQRLGDLSGMLAGGAGDLVQKGGGLLSSLLGNTLVSNIANAVARYSGLSGDSSRTLLASLFPTILGLVAGQWRSGGGTIGALTSLFADQKRNIADAVPDGLSLANIPGLGEVASALHSTGDTLRMAGDRAGQSARRGADAAGQASKTALGWLAPLAALALIAAGLWYFLGNRQQPDAAQAPAVVERETASRAEGPTARTALRPELPPLLDATNTVGVTNELKGVFTGAMDDLSNVRDAASAAVAMPKLMALNSRIDSIRAVLDKMPEAGQAAVGKMVDEHAATLRDMAAKAVAIPGAEKLRPVIDEMTAKLAGLNPTKVSQNATDIFASLTKSLEGIKDSASAQKALPDLEQLSTRIDELSKVQKSMSPGGQSMLAQIVAAARPGLEKLVSSVMTLLGADDAAIKPVVNDILAKVNGLAKPSN
jgi:hypothetical protein